MPPSTFTCFPRLAAELRLKIWSFTVLEPRILELERRTLADGTTRWHSPTPSGAIVPSTLYACHESREEARKLYHQLSFGVWMNFLVDTLYVRLPSETNLNFEEELLNFQEWLLALIQTDASLKGLRFLALWSDTWHKIYLMGSRFKLLQALPELFELTIITDDDGLSRREYPMWWNEGTEISFVDSPDYHTLSTEGKRRQDDMRDWKYQGHLDSNHWVVDHNWPEETLTHNPPNFMFRTVRRDRKAPWA
ncbi:MAG: hypothetical protein M1830_008884 [Pleopsidium flavum]|nr:MAG: hypothetical protein M1830_008884 [Pleopsidium flavum]